MYGQRGVRDNTAGMQLRTRADYLFQPAFLSVLFRGVLNAVVTGLKNTHQWFGGFVFVEAPHRSKEANETTRDALGTPSYKGA